MTVIRTVQGGGQIFYCPGCRYCHSVNTRLNGPRWSYNGDPVKPTFMPSIVLTHEWGSEENPQKAVCHSWVRDGQIQFLADSTHALAGKTVPLPAWPYPPGEYGGIEEQT